MIRLARLDYERTSSQNRRTASYRRTKGYNVKVLAIHTGVDVRTLERRFREQCATTPKHWIMVQRMKSAMPFLATGLGNKEVAASLGYTCESNFAATSNDTLAARRRSSHAVQGLVAGMSLFDKELSHLIDAHDCKGKSFVIKKHPL